MRSPAVAAVLADRPLVEHLIGALAQAPSVLQRGTCATTTCGNDHGIGRRLCGPCRRSNRLASQKRWRDQNLAEWREQRRSAAA